jgi:hypothetical protein
MDKNQRADLAARISHDLMRVYVHPNGEEVITREEGRAQALAERIVEMCVGSLESGAETAPIPHREVAENTPAPERPRR